MSSDGPRPLYAIDGEERILVDEAIQAIKDATLTAASKDFNFDIFTGKESKVPTIVDAAQTLPAFAPMRLVLVKDADKIPADQTEPLIAYAGSPSPTTTLVLVGEKFDARTKLYKAFSKAKSTMRFARLREREMPMHLRRRAKAQGIELDGDAAFALVGSVGTDLGLGVAALEKLALYVGPNSGARVTKEHVDIVVSHAKEESIFAFADAVSARDRALALATLHGMLSQTKGHPLGIVGMLARHWRRLARARSELDAKIPRGEIEAGFGVPPFVARKLLGQAQSVNVERLVGGLEAITKADQALKGTKLPAGRVMEGLVLTLTRR